MQRSAARMSALAIVLTLATSAWGQAKFDLVASEGDTFPWSGGSLNGMTRPMVGPDGSVTWSCSFSRNQEYQHGRFVWQNGQVRLVAQRGDVAPGTPANYRFDWEQTLNRLDQAGRLTFAESAYLNGDGDLTEHMGIWRESSPGTLEAVAVRGMPAHGGAPGETYQSVDHMLSLSADGTVVYQGRLETTETTKGLWRSKPGQAPELLIRSGEDNLPGFGEGEYMHWASTWYMSTNRVGQVAVSGGLSGSPSTRSSALWRTNATTGELELAFVEGQSLSTPGGGLSAAYFGETDMNDAGNIVSKSVVSGAGVTSDNRDAVLASNGTELRLVAREGDQAPGCDGDVRFGRGSYSFIDNVQINNRNQLALLGWLIGDDVTNENNHGLWAEIPGQGLQLLLREGDEAPLIGGGATVSGFYDSYLTESGRMLIPTTIQGGDVSYSNDEVLYVMQPDGSLEMLLREGQVIEPEPGRFVTVPSLAGHIKGVNALDQFAMVLDVDGTTHDRLYRVTIPEPASMSLLAIGGLALVIRRRKR